MWGLRRRAMGDAAQDSADLTMLDAASALRDAFAAGSVTSAPNGYVSNFQTTYNRSSIGKSSPLKVDGRYGAFSQNALQSALNFPSPTTGQPLGGAAPAGFNYGGPGPGTVVLPTTTITPTTATSPTIPTIPGSTVVSKTTTTRTTTKAGMGAGGVFVLLLAAGAAAYGGYEVMRRQQHRRSNPCAHMTRRRRRR